MKEARGVDADAQVLMQKLSAAIDRKVKPNHLPAAQQKSGGRTLRKDGEIDGRVYARGKSDRKGHSFEAMANHINSFEVWASDNYAGGISAYGSVAAYIRANKLDIKFVKNLSKGKGGWREPTMRQKIVN